MSANKHQRSIFLLFMVVGLAFLYSVVFLSQPKKESVELGAAIVPSRTLTPGDVLPVTEKEVCVPGYAKSVRDVGASTKRAVFELYGIKYPPPKGAYEVDHLINLSIGGSNDIKNLWPQPASPKPGFHEKDRLEFWLWKQVCSGKMTLKEAQNNMLSNWHNSYINMKKQTLGSQELNAYEESEEGNP